MRDTSTNFFDISTSSTSALNLVDTKPVPVPVRFRYYKESRSRNKNRALQTLINDKVATFAYETMQISIIRIWKKTAIYTMYGTIPTQMLLF